MGCKPRVVGLDSFNTKQEEEAKSKAETLANKVRSANDYMVINRLPEAFVGMPQKLINEHMLFITKGKILSLFNIDTMVPSTLDMNAMLDSIEYNLMPAIREPIIFILSQPQISNKQLEVMKNEISNIIFSFIKLEYLRHTIVFKDLTNKNYIDDIVDGLVLAVREGKA